jgi:hypothetical protein
MVGGVVSGAKIQREFPPSFLQAEVALPSVALVTALLAMAA